MPTWDGVLVRYGEIGIKSAPVRRTMVERLRSNLLDAMERAKLEGDVRLLGSRLWMAGPDPLALAKLATHVFGVVSASPCKLVGGNLETLQVEAPKLALEYPWSRFAVKARREGTHTFSSQDINIQVGSAVFLAAQAAGRKPVVDLKTPEFALEVDVRQDKAYLFVDHLQGPGGIPSGTQGTVLALVSDQASFVAAWMMMRRGCTVVPVHAGDTGSLPVEAVEAMAQWGFPTEVELLPVCTGKTSKATLLAAAATIATEKGASALVTGERLESRLVSAPMPVLRPACGLDPEEYSTWRDLSGVPATDEPSILDDNARETVASLLSMRRTVSP